MKFKDITGNLSGRLTVVAFQGRDKWGNIVWDCLCECGTPTTANTGSLKSGISGVDWSKQNNKWQVRIGVNGKVIDLGRTLDIDVAREWRRAAELKYYGFYKTPEKEVKDEV